MEVVESVEAEEMEWTMLEEDWRVEHDTVIGRGLEEMRTRPSMPSRVK